MRVRPSGPTPTSARVVSDLWRDRRAKVFRMEKLVVRENRDMAPVDERLGTTKLLADAV
jgi:hypothetical protein